MKYIIYDDMGIILTRKQDTISQAINKIRKDYGDNTTVNMKA